MENSTNLKTLHERLEYIRTYNKLTQIEFGNRIGFKQSNVSRNEKGSQEVSEPYIKSVCREYNVDELWLRTGIGSPFKIEKNSQDENITAFASRLIAKDKDSFIKSLLEAISELTEEQQDCLEIVGKAILNNIAKNNNKKSI